MKHQPFTGDPLEALRRADPLDPREMPPDTSGAHARALFQEVTSMNATDKGTAPQRQPWLRRVALGAAAAVIVAAVAGGAYALLRDKADEVIVGGEPIGGDAMAMCIQYTDEMLAGLDVAFDGTLVSLTPIEASSEVDFGGATAVFEVHRWFKGGEGTEFTMTAPWPIGPESIALVGATLEVGQRYLVSGDDGYVWACGYTLTYDTALADHWAELFGA